MSVDPARAAWEPVSLLTSAERPLSSWLERLRELDPLLHAFLPEPARDERLLQELEHLESDADPGASLRGVPLALEDSAAGAHPQQGIR